jgi:hypothetical protein
MFVVILNKCLIFDNFCILKFSHRALDGKMGKSAQSNRLRREKEIKVGTERHLLSNFLIHPPGYVHKIL